MFENDEIYEAAVQLGQVLLQHKLRCAVAESCTGGALSAAITAVPGSSQWFERGFVTYSNLAKQELLGIDESLLQSKGAVSQEVAEAMAFGALQHASAEISVAVTGIAGPDGGSIEKPVGTVWIAWAYNKDVFSEKYLFTGNRAQIREQTVLVALQKLTLTI